MNTYRGLSRVPYTVGHFSNSILPSAIYVITFSLVTSTLMAANIVDRAEVFDLNKNISDKLPPIDFPETSTQNLATASPEQIRNLTSHSDFVQSEAEDMMNSKVNKTDAVVDRDGKDSSLETIGSSNTTISQRAGETNSTLDTNSTATTTTTTTTTTMNENSETPINSTMITETTTLVAMTTPQIISSTTTPPTTTIATTTIATTTATTAWTTTTTTTIATTQLQMTDTPKTESPPETATSAEENGKMPSGIIVLVTMITFAVVAVMGYVSLIVWRRYLEFRYGNRELLVNDLEFDTNDLRHFEL